MSKGVALALSSGAKQTYERWLFLNYALLPDILGNAGPNDMVATDNLQQLAPLETLRGQDIINHGTPFFWMNVHRCHLENITSRISLDNIIRHLLMTAFDSYFKLLPNGATFRLTSVKDSHLILPQLGIYMPVSENVVLRRISLIELDIEFLGIHRYVNLTNIEPALRLPALSIPGYSHMKLLLVYDPSLLGEGYVNQLVPHVPKPANLAKIIGESLDLIKMIDSEILARLTSLIKWFIPLTTTNLTQYNSFTDEELIGVLFLSESEKFAIAEAIVHELHQSELNMLRYHQVLHRQLEENLYYSPWSEDPRPLFGLIHGLHEFAGAADFLAKAEKLRILKHYKQRLRYRRLKICYQIRLCLAQIPSDHLAPLGIQIIESIEKDLQHHQEDFGSLRADLPEELKQHLNSWCARNPKLTTNVRTPR